MALISIEYDEKGYELSKELQQQHLEKHPLPHDNFMETVRIITQARDIVDEIVLNDLIYR